MYSAETWTQYPLALRDAMKLIFKKTSTLLIAELIKWTDPCSLVSLSSVYSLARSAPVRLFITGSSAVQVWTAEHHHDSDSRTKGTFHRYSRPNVHPSSKPPKSFYILRIWSVRYSPDICMITLFYMYVLLVNRHFDELKNKNMYMVYFHRSDVREDLGTVCSVSPPLYEEASPDWRGFIDFIHSLLIISKSTDIEN